MWSFTFKGESSRDYGITVNRRAPRQSANMRTVITGVDGTDGAYIEKVGYNTYTMSISMTIQGKENLLRISSWLKGRGEFTRSDIPKRGLLVEHQAELNYVMIVEDLYSCDTTFQVIHPHWYLIEDTWSRPWGENLIPNGWDSFEPYGSGKNYVNNWNFETDDLSEWQGSYGEHKIVEGVYTKEITETSGAARAEYYSIVPSGKYVARIKIRSNKKIRIRNWENIEETISSIIEPSKDFFVFEQEINVISDTDNLRLRFYVDTTESSKGQIYEIDWIQITPVDNQHLVVEKTPLENGLTRIQTWGGSTLIKLSSRINTDLSEGDVTTTSLYVEDNKNTFRINQSGGTYIDNPYINISKDEIGVFSYIGIAVKDIKAYNFFVRGINITDNLDFIASTPTIVEGDKPPTWEADSNPRIVNEGNTTAYPIIRLVKGKEETVDVVVDGVRFVYNFKENDTYVDIDCFTQETYSEKRKTNRQLKIGYKYPALKPGDNVVKINKGDPTILFRRKDAWR